VLECERDGERVRVMDRERDSRRGSHGLAAGLVDSEYTKSTLRLEEDYTNDSFRSFFHGKIDDGRLK
jgi:hypothetical protein